MAESDKQRRSDLVEVRNVVDYVGILEKLVDGSRKVTVSQLAAPKKQRRSNLVDKAFNVEMH